MCKRNLIYAVLLTLAFVAIIAVNLPFGSPGASGQTPAAAPVLTPTSTSPNATPTLAATPTQKPVTPGETYFVIFAPAAP
jgi:hypothetical protein